MSGESHFLLAFCGAAAVSLACGFLIWPLASAVWPDVRDKIRRFLRLPLWAKVTLLVFVFGFIAYGSTKTNQVDQAGGTNVVGIVEGGTNDVDEVTSDGEVDGGDEPDGGGTNAPPMMLMSLMPPASDEPQTVTFEDIVRGWRLREVRTNDCVVYAMPEGATLATNWWVRGAYEDVRRLDLGGGTGCDALPWRFPFGTNEHDSAWAFSWGKLRFAPGDAAGEIVAVGAPMAAVPHRSRLWTAVDVNGSRLVTWENFALGRDTNAPVNAQIELRPTGDFVTRSNEVETVCLRVDPEDWDGDGWQNDDDPDPCNADEFGDEFCQELPIGANEAAYYWIDICPRWNSWIEFYGDGPSDLDDPCFWAKAGETYRVTLLIGKTYAVESSRPIDIVGRSSPSVEIDGDGTCSLGVVWPVRFSALEGNGASFMMRVVPSSLGGEFEWLWHCCGITGYGNQFWWAHDRYCWCEGCYAQGRYSYEGYELECEGGHCCCPHDEDPYEPEEDDGPHAAGASVTFSAAAVIFESAYTNMPGEVVARRSTRTTLTCVAHGGETGGTASFSIVNGDRLVTCAGGSLPVTRFVPPRQKLEFEIEYEGLLPSDALGDIVARADFTERETGTRHQTYSDDLTSVKIELTAVYDAPENHNPSRHVYGVGEKVRFAVTPALTDVILTTSKQDDGDDDPDSEYELFGCEARTNGAASCVYTCPISGNYHPQIEIFLSDVTYCPDMAIVEPNEVITPFAGWGVNVVSGSYVGNRKCWPEGVVGAACLVTTNYIGPMYVSFQGIAVSELPCTEEDIVTGCFTNGHRRTHTGGIDGAGAGYAHYIRPGNFWFVDGARMAAPEENWIPNSTLSWKIPVGWHRKNPRFADYHVVNEPDYEVRFSNASRLLMIGGRNDMYKQRWHIDLSGTYRTDKFGHWISRSRNCVIILDGEILQEEHP